MTDQQNTTSPGVEVPASHTRSSIRVTAMLLRAAAVLFVTEQAIMCFLPKLGLEGIWDAVVDSLLLAILALPALYALGFRGSKQFETGSVPHNTRLEKRMLLLLGTNVALALAVLAIYGLAGRSQGADSHLINLAGRQRMLAQGLVKDAVVEAMGQLRAAPGKRRSGVPAHITRASSQFERVLHGLMRGDAELELPACTIEEGRRQLEKVEAAWKPLRTLLDRTSGITTPDEAFTHSNELQAAGERVLAEMDLAVTLLGEHHQDRTSLLDIPLGSAIVAVTLISLSLAVTLVRVMNNRKRLEASLSRINVDLLAVNKVHKALFACRSTSEVAGTLTDAMVDEFGAHFGRVWLVRPGDLCPQCKLAEHCRDKEQCLHLVASSGCYSHVDGDHRRVPLGAFKIGLIAKGRGKTICNDVTTDERVHDRQWATKLGLQSFAGFPLMHDGEVIGVMAMFSRQTLPPHLLESLDLLTQLGVSAIENVTKTESISQAMVEIERQNRFLNTVLESLPHPFSVIDAEDYRVLTANSAARRDAPAGAKSCHTMTHQRDTPCDGAEHPCPLVEVKRTGEPSMAEHTHAHADGSAMPIEVHAFPVFDEDGKVVQVIEYSLDITERKVAEAKVDKVNKQLHSLSHQAGMAEIATGVLHNVGNVLNSVNVSASLLADKVQKSKVSGVAKASSLMNEHAHDLGSFIVEDEKGKKLPGYLAKLAAHLADEQGSMLEELDSLSKNVDHIKRIVSAQQSHAGASGVTESVSIADVVNAAISINSTTFDRHEIEIVREFADLPPTTIDKQKVLAILVNLIQNAKQALRDAPCGNRRLTVRVGLTENDDVRIEVVDNGKGIASENMASIFSHGFTTKADGHGFGLHSAALAAKEMGGSLGVSSDGLGKGATFTIEFPLQPAEGVA